MCRGCPMRSALGSWHAVLSSCRAVVFDCRCAPRRLFAVRSRVGSVEGGVRISAYARPACDRCGSLEGKAPRAHMKTKCLIDDNDITSEGCSEIYTDPYLLRFKFNR